MKIKFNRLLVTIIGLVLLIGIGCLLWFLMIKPAKEKLAAKEAEYQPIKQYNETLLVTTQKNRDVEFKKAALIEKTYNNYMSRFMPMLDFGRRDMGMISYWREYENMKKVVEEFGNDPNLTTTISLNVPTPPTNPNDSLFDSPFIQYTGTVTVTGDFTSILNNITRWSNAPRLVLVSPNISMTMQGDDPNKVTASYGIVCFVIPWQSGGSSITMAPGGGASGQTTGAMGMGGMSGGMPGMSAMPGATGAGMGAPGAMPTGPGMSTPGAMPSAGPGMSTPSGAPRS